MAIEDVTRPAVERALKEFRRPGREKFLKEYGFGASRGWMLIDEQGNPYDAKVVLGAAHGFVSRGSKPLTQDVSHGGRATAKILRALEFNVPGPGELPPIPERCRRGGGGNGVVA